MQSLQPRQESEGDCQRLPGGNKSGRRAGRGRTTQEPPPSSQRRHHRSCWQEGEMLLPTLVYDRGGRKWHRESDRHTTTDQVEPGSGLLSTTGQVFVLPGDKKLAGQGPPSHSTTRRSTKPGSPVLMALSTRPCTWPSCLPQMPLPP